jgi:hypothetical protein
MFPHERSLVKKLANRPFVLLGVNGDGDNPELRKLNEKAQITWRSFKNERPGRGPIMTEWAITGLPTLFLIDHQGVIRERWVGAPEDKALEEAIEKYVHRAEDDKK